MAMIERTRRHTGSNELDDAGIPLGTRFETRSLQMRKFCCPRCGHEIAQGEYIAADAKLIVSRISSGKIPCPNC